ELGQLECRVSFDLLVGNRFESIYVGHSGAPRLGRVGDAFAQVVQANQQSLRVEGLGNDDAVGQLFAGDIALRQPSQQIVAHDHAVDRPPIGQVQQRTLQQGVNQTLYALTGLQYQPARVPPRRSVRPPG